MSGRIGYYPGSGDDGHLVCVANNAGMSDDWGAERFAVAFLFADAIMTYHQLFCNEYGHLERIL